MIFNISSTGRASQKLLTLEVRGTRKPGEGRRAMEEDRSLSYQIPTDIKQFKIYTTGMTTCCVLAECLP